MIKNFEDLILDELDYFELDKLDEAVKNAENKSKGGKNA